MISLVTFENWMTLLIFWIMNFIWGLLLTCYFVLKKLLHKDLFII